MRTVVTAVERSSHAEHQAADLAVWVFEPLRHGSRAQLTSSVMGPPMAGVGTPVWTNCDQARRVALQGCGHLALPAVPC